AEIAGDATPEQLAALHADPVAWQASLLSMLRETEDHLASARSLRGEERDLVIADLEAEHRRLADAWARITGLTRGTPADRGSRAARARDHDEEPAEEESGVLEIH